MSHDSSSKHYLNVDFDYASLTVYTPIAPPAANSYNGTHHSIMGVGGYMEVPTIDHMYDLTIDKGLLNPDGYSSGKRRVGMIVYVLESKKFYQLTPRKRQDLDSDNVPEANPQLVSFQIENDGFSEWGRASAVQRLCWLDPVVGGDNSAYDTVTEEEAFGSRIKSDCWTEIFISKGWEDKTSEFAPAIIPPFSPKRPVYFVADNSTSIPNTEPHFDALSKDFNLSDGSVFGIQVGTNTKRIVIAYPSAYGDLTRVIDSSTGFNIIGSFNKTTFDKLPPLSTDFTPPNTNYDGLTSIQYNVYTSILAISYSSPTVYTVTI